MAYKVDPGVKSVHGTNPQNLIERIVRDRIFSSKYWKEQCFGLNVADLVGRAMQLKYAGGTFGTHRCVSPFICLLLKLLMIQPPDDIVHALIQEEHFRYVRLIGAFYLRLTGTSVEIYKCLERLYPDNRKFKLRHLDGSFSIEYIDQFIDQLLHEERVFDTTLPRLALRHVLAEQNLLPPQRPSLLDAELRDYGQNDDKEKNAPKGTSESSVHFSSKNNNTFDRPDDQSPTSIIPRRRRLGDRSLSPSPPPRRRSDDRSPTSSPPRTRRPGDRSPSSSPPPRRRSDDWSPTSSPPRTRRLGDRSPSPSPPRRKRLEDRSVSISSNPLLHSKRIKTTTHLNPRSNARHQSSRSGHQSRSESISHYCRKEAKQRERRGHSSPDSHDGSDSDDYEELKILRARESLDVDLDEPDTKNVKGKPDAVEARHEIDSGRKTTLNHHPSVDLASYGSYASPSKVYSQTYHRSRLIQSCFLL